MATEFEVYSPVLEPYLGALVFFTKEDADTLVYTLEKESGLNWFVREVEAGKRPIPPKADVPMPLLVDDVRRLMALRGQDILVTCAWNRTSGQVNIVTVGSDAEFSSKAAQLGQDIAVIAGCDPKQATLCEDRRDEHQSPNPGSPGVNPP